MAMQGRARGSGTAIAALALAASMALTAIVCPAGAAAASGVELTDDRGRSLRIERAAPRIVSLAPHATELLFAAGAGDRVVAVDTHSDHPPEVASLARLRSYPSPDAEALLALRPDLVVLWGAAAGADRLQRLESLGLTVFVSEPRSLEAIATSLERFARLAADPAPGLARAQRFRAQVAALRGRSAHRAPLPVFVQAWTRPLFTLSDRDTIGDALRVCGAHNLFGDAAAAAPQLGPEAVLAAGPRLIVAVDADGDRSRWDELRVLRPAGRIAFARIDPAIQRPTERVLPLLEQLCAAVDAAR